MRAIAPSAEALTDRQHVLRAERSVGVTQRIAKRDPLPPFDLNALIGPSLKDSNVPCTPIHRDRPLHPP